MNFNIKSFILYTNGDFIGLVFFSFKWDESKWRNRVDVSNLMNNRIVIGQFEMKEQYIYNFMK